MRDRFMDANAISIEIRIESLIEQVWEYFTMPEHIVNWNFASDEWCCPSAENDLRTGGKFVWRMESKDGSIGFDYTGIYRQIVDKELIVYEISDGRNFKIEFLQERSKVRLIEIFEPEEVNTIDIQKAGWFAILENFKKYVEGK